MNKKITRCDRCKYHYVIADGYDSILCEYYCTYFNKHRLVKNNIEWNWELGDPPSWCPIK